MKYLLDTSVLLLYLHGEVGENVFSSYMSGHVTSLSFATLTELYYKLMPHLFPLGGEAYRRILLLPFGRVWASPSLCELAGRLKGDYGLGLGDSFIAASALEGHFVLVHRDRDFLRVKELKQEYLK